MNKAEEPWAIEVTDDEADRLGSRQRVEHFEQIVAGCFGQQMGTEVGADHRCQVEQFVVSCAESPRAGEQQSVHRGAGLTMRIVDQFPHQERVAARLCIDVIDVQAPVPGRHQRPDLGLFEAVQGHPVNVRLTTELAE